MSEMQILYLTLASVNAVFFVITWLKIEGLSKQNKELKYRLGQLKRSNTYAVKRDNIIIKQGIKILKQVERVLLWVH